MMTHTDMLKAASVAPPNHDAHRRLAKLPGGFGALAGMPVDAIRALVEGGRGAYEWERPGLLSRSGVQGLFGRGQHGLHRLPGSFTGGWRAPGHGLRAKAHADRLQSTLRGLSRPHGGSRDALETLVAALLAATLASPGGRATSIGAGLGAGAGALMGRLSRAGSRPGGEWVQYPMAAIGGLTGGLVGHWAQGGRRDRKERREDRDE